MQGTNPIPTELAPLTRRKTLVVIVAALLACAAKLYCAWTTIGSNDVTTFLDFARVIDAGGLEAAYRLGPIFNHPPLVGGFLLTINWLAQTAHLPFPFLLRLPAIFADLVVVLVLLWFTSRRPALRVPLAVWLVLALSPVSFMVSGYHGNTDPVLVLWLVLAAMMCAEDQPAASGLFLALSLHIKIAGLIVAPVLFFYWLARHRAWKFSLACGAVVLVGWAEPLMVCPADFLRNVFGYSSYWGFWGITYWLRMTSFPAFYGHPISHPSPAEHAVVTILKLLIVAAIMVLAWRRRRLPGEQIFSTLALAWAIFFTFSPGVAPQYLVWPACFLFLYSWRWFLVVTGASTLFLFFFYNAISRGMPWFYGRADAEVSPFIDPWTNWPWLALAAGLYWMWKKEGSPRLLCLETPPAAK
jgi:hypothetical protein